MIIFKVVFAFIKLVFFFFNIKVDVIDAHITYLLLQYIIEQISIVFYFK